MDSLTQLTLGAAVGEAVGGKNASVRAPLWGAFFGTLPDLDVLVNPVLTEVQQLTFHRSISHSLLFVGIVTVLAALGLRRLHKDTPLSSRQWFSLVGAVLLTHIGLDCLTTYGTQIFWPFTREPILLGTIFVIDPLYTAPLATGLFLALRRAPDHRMRRWFNYAGLTLSSVYLLFTIGNKLYVHSVFRDDLARKTPSAQRLITGPTPINNALWRGVAETETGFYVGYYSIFDDSRSIDFEWIPKQHKLLERQTNSPVVQRFRRFSRGYFVVRRSSNGGYTIHDLRFGRNDVGLTPYGEYIFSFRLVEDEEGNIVGLQPEQPPLQLSRPLLRRFLARIRGRTDSLPRSSIEME